ncbi:MAG: RNA-binding protein [Oscillospiraceae bacterium]|jgi:RNA-binding protein YlmH|nr:RNA-binding protein [Oscillospiraceae bacterium]
MNLASVTEEEKLLLRRLGDLADLAAQRNTPRFSFFLSEGQLLLAQAFVEQNHIENAMFYGGYDGAARKACGFFPHYDDPEAGHFPITPLTLTFMKEKKLTHRDFLGSLMGLGIKRESVGDILASEGRCILFLLDSIAPFVMQELIKVGNTGVKCSQGFDAAHIPQPEFTTLSGTVSSLRLDSLVKLATGLSREKSAVLIRGGTVRHNHSETQNISQSFNVDDTLSIRGYGRFIVDAVGAPTRKGRLPVRILKYI